MQENPDHYISKLVSKASDSNCSFVKYYKNLEESYTNTDDCEKKLVDDFKTTYKTKIIAASNDRDSRLGTYLSINPSLSKPEFKDKLEFQRVCISRYRTGSHNLKIESGRITNTDREERLCLCNTGIQSISHVLLHCPMLDTIREKYHVANVVDGIMQENFLLEMERTLGIERTF